MKPRATPLPSGAALAGPKPSPLRPSDVPPAAWRYPAGRVLAGREIVSGSGAAERAAFYGDLAAAEAAGEGVLWLPYVGAWDHHGTPVQHLDLVVLCPDAYGPGDDVEEEVPGLGVVRYDPYETEFRAAHFVWRLHYEILTLRRPRLVVRDGATGEREARDVRFTRHLMSYETEAADWSTIETLGPVFDRFDVLEQAGLVTDRERDAERLLAALDLPLLDATAALRDFASEA